MATETFKNASDQDIEIELPNPNGRADADDSRPVALSTEDLAKLEAIRALSSDVKDQLVLVLAKLIAAPATAAKQDTIITGLTAVSDGVAALGGKDFATQTTLAAVLAKLSADPASQTTLAAILAKLIAAPATEALQTAGNASLSTIAGKDFATQTTLAAILAKLIAAPATEATLAAASAKLPATLGAKAAADSLGTTASTEDVARIGSVTESAPASDTASSGLNGRLQRIAQRLTSLIGLFPTSLGTKADSASLAVAWSTEAKAQIGATNSSPAADENATAGLSGILRGVWVTLKSVITSGAINVNIADGGEDDVPVALQNPIPTGTNVIGKVDHSTSGVGDGIKVVTTAGTQVALAATTAAKWVVIQAQTDNTGKIAVGGSTVDAAEAAGSGIILEAGESITVPVSDLAHVFIDAAVSGEGVRFFYGT